MRGRVGMLEMMEPCWEPARTSMAPELVHEANGRVQICPHHGLKEITVRTVLDDLYGFLVYFFHANLPAKGYAYQHTAGTRCLGYVARLGPTSHAHR